MKRIPGISHGGHRIAAVVYQSEERRRGGRRGWLPRLPPSQSGRVCRNQQRPESISSSSFSSTICTNIAPAPQPLRCRLSGLYCGVVCPCGSLSSPSDDRKPADRIRNIFRILNIRPYPTRHLTIPTSRYNHSPAQDHRGPFAPFDLCYGLLFSA